MKCILGDPEACGDEGKAKRVGQKTCFSSTSQKPERRLPFGTDLVRHCPQGLLLILAVLYFSSFHIYFSARLAFSSPPLSAPGSPRMCEVMRCTQIGSILLCGIRNPMKPLWQKKASDVFVFTFLEPVYRYFMWLALYLLLLGLNFAVDSQS